MTHGATATTLSATIREISSIELEILVPALIDLLDEAVTGGASLGFLPPLSRDEAWRYWISLHTELQRGARVLLGAWYGGRLIGSGQLALSHWPSSRHRAELQKLFVDAGLRGRGVGRSIVFALHDAARRRGRSLILLNARRGDAAEGFYREIGYREIGVVPRHTIDADGTWHDSVSFYRELQPAPRR